MTRNHTIDYIEIYITDMACAKDFYGKTFGWDFTDYSEGYVGIKKNDTQEMGGFALVDQVTKGGNLVVLYSNDIDSTLKSVADNGGKISKEMFSFPGGKRFHFEDPSGNELAVWTKLGT